MTDRNLRAIVAALAGLLLVVVAATLFIIAGRDGSSTASGSASPAPSATPRASASPRGPGALPSSVAASVAPQGSLAPTASPTTATPSAEVTASPSTAAPSSPGAPPLATLTFLGLKLEPADDPAGEPRIVTFRSDGPGAITAAFRSTTSQARTHLCLKIGSKELGCKDGASGTFTGRTTQAHANWEVTLRGDGDDAPTIDLTVTFQAVAPSVKIEHARFDGTAFADTNGITTRFTPRAAGEVRLVADWGGHPFLYEVDLFDETGSGAGDMTLANQGPSTNVDETLPVTPGDWRIVLQNIEQGFGTTGLTATISWP